MKKEINIPEKQRKDGKMWLYGKGCDDERCSGNLIKFDSEYYCCTYCLLDFCKEHSENPFTNLKPEIMAKEYIEKKHHELFFKDTLKILLERGKTEPTIEEVSLTSCSNRN